MSCWQARPTSHEHIKARPNAVGPFERRNLATEAAPVVALLISLLIGLAIAVFVLLFVAIAGAVVVVSVLIRLLLRRTGAVS
jgi:hypothetical protein